MTTPTARPAVLRKNAPALFASVRSSRDTALVAFAVALLGAFALQAGAFLPRFEPRAERAQVVAERAPEAARPAVLAARPAAVLPAGHVEGSQAAAEPCEAHGAPRG